MNYIGALARGRKVLLKGFATEESPRQITYKIRNNNYKILHF